MARYPGASSAGVTGPTIRNASATFGVHLFPKGETFQKARMRRLAMWTRRDMSIDAVTLADDPLVQDILVVEDDPEIGALIARYLGEHGFHVTVVEDGAAMDRHLGDARTDLIVLDVNLPDENGFDICVRLRRTEAPPIVMLTARGEDMDRILGLELGADDYLTKPFNPRELLARIKAVLRRSRPDTPTPDTEKTYEFQGFQMQIDGRRLVDPAGVRIILTGSEFEILRALVENAGRVLSREQLRTKAALAPGALDRSIDIIVSRLRQKIERDVRAPDIIQTVRSIGYVFAPSVKTQ